MASRKKTTVQRGAAASAKSDAKTKSPTKRAGTPRTASGKKAHPGLLAAAQQRQAAHADIPATDDQKAGHLGDTRHRHQAQAK
mgnify:CR=1 FL=1